MDVAAIQGARRRERIVVKHGFLEFRSRGSFLERLDPRFSLAAVLAAVLAISSEPAGEVAPFGLYFLLITLAALLARARPVELARRTAAATPFIAAAALVPWIGVVAGGDAAVDVGPRWAASVALRAYAALLLLSILTIACAPDRLATAMRRLYFPPALSAVLVLMYRYLFLLADEWGRLAQARACRSAGELAIPRLEFYSKQLGVLFLRSYDRAGRVQGAMTVRGYSGAFPTAEPQTATTFDWLFLIGVTAVFWCVRLRHALPLFD